MASSKNNMGKPKQWKSGGPEDILLKKLIKKGKINKLTTPSAVQKMNPGMFSGFKEQVMRNHLKSVKRDNGLFLDEGEESDHSNEEDDDDESKEVEKLPEKVDQALLNSNTDFLAASYSDKTIQMNYPVVTTQFVCPETENEKVLMVVSLPGGATNPDVALQDDGFWVYVKYTWSKTMFNVRDLFKPQLDNNEFEDYHPMVTSYKSGLSKVRKRIDLAPNGLIKVFLPIKVQTTASSYTIWGIKRPDGTNVALATFTGSSKEYNNKVADQKLKYL